MEKACESAVQNQVWLELLCDETVILEDPEGTGVREDAHRAEHCPDGENGALNAENAPIDVRRGDDRSGARGDPHVGPPGSPDDEKTLLRPRGHGEWLPVVEFGDRTDTREDRHRLARPPND